MRTLVIASFVLFVLSVTIPFTSLASTHPCQFPTPPSVPDPLVDPSPSAGNLFINEVLLTPHANWNCSDTSTPSPINDTWVEIYNSQDVAYNLYDVQAALDHGQGTDPFYFPLHAAIAPHSFLVVFPGTSANFLSSEMPTLRLLISGIAVDTIKLPLFNMPIDTSYARIPDGSTTNPMQLLSDPTIGASNPTLQQTTMASTATSHAATAIRTPTPKPSPTPHHTPTPRATKKSTSGGDGKQDGSTTDNGQGDENQSDSAVLVDGVQPAWNKLPVPASATPSSTASSGVAISTDETLIASDNSSGNGTIRNIEITVVALLLAGGLLWCWKLFISPALQKQRE